VRSHVQDKQDNIWLEQSVFGQIQDFERVEGEDIVMLNVSHVS